MLVTEAEAVAAVARARKARAVLQFACPHEHVIASDSGADKFHIRTPFRVCLLCGFAEQAWSCGNQILTRKPDRDLVPYDEAAQYVRGEYPCIHDNAQFVGYHLDVKAAGGQAAYTRAVLLRVLGLTKDDVHEVKA